MRVDEWLSKSVILVRIDFNGQIKVVIDIH